MLLFALVMVSLITDGGIRFQVWDILNVGIDAGNIRGESEHGMDMHHAAWQY